MTALRWLTESPELAPFPGWSLGQSPRQTALQRVRRIICAAARRSGSKVTVVVPWLAGTDVELVLASDFGTALFAGGCYEPNEMYLLSKLLVPGSVFIDVGASMGLYTTFAASLVGKGGRVIAIEPSSRDRDLLERNVNRNALTNVSVDRRAIADKELEQRRLRITDRVHSGQNTFGDVVYPAAQVVGFEDVEVTTLDRLVADHRLARVDVVKMDVEGAEHAAMVGASSTLHKWRPVVMMELQDESLRRQDSSATAVTDLLGDYGYDLYAYGTDGHEKSWFSHLPRELDMRRLSSEERCVAQNIVAIPSETI